MLVSTKGVVINFVKYGDTSIIVRVFTEMMGRRSFIVNGVRSARSRSRIALFQPLSLLDLVIYDRPSSSINRLKEFRSLYPYQSIPFDFRKSTVAMFLTELLDRSLREETETEEVFHFLNEALVYFDSVASDHDFHLKFMVHWARLQGFGAESAEEIFEQLSHSSLPMADLLYGLRPVLPDLQLLLSTDMSQPCQLGGVTRRIILSALVHFFQLHVEGMRRMKSLPVLQEMMAV